MKKSKLDARDEAMDKRIAKAIPQGLEVEYSVLDDDEEDNLDKTAAAGKVKFMQKADWGNGLDYESPVVVNPSWLEVVVFANTMMHMTSDFHHCFLEGIYKSKKRPVHGVQIYHFAMGS